jgi:hypothetical protein
MYEDFSILPLYNQINELNQKNDVVETYYIVTDKLEEYYNLFEQTNANGVENFLNEVATKDQSYNQIINERRKKVQTLFDKVSNYMENSITRKTKLFKAEKDLMDKMKDNEEKSHNELENIKINIQNLDANEQKLETANRDMVKNMRECEIVETLTSKCNESSEIYESIMNAYNQQTETLQNIYNTLTQN